MRMTGITCFLSVVFFSFLSTTSVVMVVRATTAPILLRIRQRDGSVRRVVVRGSADDNDDDPAELVLARLLLPTEEGAGFVAGDDALPLDMSKSLRELDLHHRNGTLLTLRSTNTTTNSTSAVSVCSSSSSTSSKPRFDPYPELAKRTSYRRTKALLLAKRSRGMSYADVEKLQASMHQIEPNQKADPVKRLYMCHASAARFRSTMGDNNKVGLLLGTVNMERVEQKTKARTSLSSTTESAKKCRVAKVHAVWEPPPKFPQGTSTSQHYDAGALHDGVASHRALELAAALGLWPVGWLYTYDDSDVRREAELPVLSRDVWHGARLQCRVLQQRGDNHDHGAECFVTLAMDAADGATEGFQLSDVAVQMVAEGGLSLEHDDDGRDRRYFRTLDPVLVDGSETHEVDSVLCLVNTAMLSHRGMFCDGGAAVATTKKGALTAKTKRRILAALGGDRDSKDNDNALQVLCDFHILCGLDRVLGKKDMDELVKLVTLYARGQKKGTKIGPNLRLLLQGVLGG